MGVGIEEDVTLAVIADAETVGEAERDRVAVGLGVTVAGMLEVGDRVAILDLVLVEVGAPERVDETVDTDERVPLAVTDTVGGRGERDREGDCVAVGVTDFDCDGVVAVAAAA